MTNIYTVRDSFQTMNKFDQPDTYKITELLKPIGIGFGIFLFLLAVSCIPAMLENAKTPDEQVTAIISFLVFMLVLCFFVVVRMIKRI